MVSWYIIISGYIIVCIILIISIVIKTSKKSSFNNKYTKDGRCVKFLENNINQEIYKKFLKHEIDPPDDIYASCSDKYDSRYGPPVFARFLKIYRIDNTSKPIIISNISINLDNYSSYNVKNMFAWTNSISIENGEINWPNKILSTNSSNFKTGEGGYLQIDLVSTYKIRSISITHNTTEDAKSLIGTKILLISENKNDHNMGYVVYEKNITTSEKNRFINVESLMKPYPIKVNKKFTWPCMYSECTDKNNELLLNYNYDVNNYCVSPIVPVDSRILDLYNNVDNVYLKSCK